MCMRKTLAAGNESFIDMIRDNRYYVDKTGFIKPLMESGSYVQLITRPRRFGKTLFMDTLHRFLEINPQNPGDASKQKALFDNFNISKDQEFCTQFMGQYPVLFVSLKDFKGLDFNSARIEFAHTLLQKTQSYSYLLDSHKLSSFDKEFLKNCCSLEFLKNPDNFDIAKKYLTYMVQILAKHYDRQVILLIDEYDVPLQKSIKSGYYKEMLEFMQSFLALLKSSADLRVNDRQALRKTILTGCLRVSKASIFTDVNNFDVNSVSIQGGYLSAAIGFTEQEVNHLLNYYGLKDQESIVKEWYDGYHIGTSEIYCPWDVIRFCEDIQNPDIDRKKFKPTNYWADTSSNDVIEEFLEFLSSEDADKMQTLIDGGEIEIQVNDQLTYGDFKKHRSEDFWTLLLYTGYLTITEILGKGHYKLRIPNLEIRETFSSRIKSYFSDENERYIQRSDAVADSFFKGDAITVKTKLSELLENYVSVRDTATKAIAENYYHGFLMGLLSSSDKVKNLSSNKEAGDGYADMLFTSPGAVVGIVLEIKHCNNVKSLTAEANKAIEQIKEKRYTQGLEGYACSKTYGFGIAFCRKACVVIAKELL